MQNSRNSLKILSIFPWNISGAFFSRKGIRAHSYYPLGVLKIVSGIVSSSSLIHQKPNLPSNFLYISSLITKEVNVSF